MVSLAAMWLLHLGVLINAHTQGIYSHVTSFHPEKGLVYPTSIFHLLGLLSAVGSLELAVLNYSTIRLTWTAPFTLDITGVDPDISYYVNVSGTSDSRELYDASYNIIITTNFTFELPSRSGCFRWYFGVIPVNPVGIGTGEYIQYQQQGG